MTYPHRYKNGKILQPITNEQLEAALAHPYNRKLKHQAFIVLLYYTGVRVSELLRATKDQFNANHATLYWDVGIRLKHGKHTSPLPLSLTLPHMHLAIEQLNHARRSKKNPEGRVFNFSRSTAWLHCAKTGLGYNHLMRLTAITFFLKAGYGIAHIVNWFGITVETVNKYIGEVDLAEMGAIKRW